MGFCTFISVAQVEIQNFLRCSNSHGDTGNGIIEKLFDGLQMIMMRRFCLLRQCAVGNRHRLHLYVHVMWRHWRSKPFPQSLIGCRIIRGCAGFAKFLVCPEAVVHLVDVVAPEGANGMCKHRFVICTEYGG